MPPARRHPARDRARRGTVAVLSPAQIAARLDQRFRLLAGAQRGAIERHATLRAAIDWSYDLLEPDEQLVLARLSVFAGGCTLEAAEAVCAGGPIAPDGVLDLIGSLVARSLVDTDAGDPHETTYRLLETIRQYAEEHLDPDDRAATTERQRGTTPNGSRTRPRRCGAPTRPSGSGP